MDQKRGEEKGRFDGQAIEADEYVTDVYRRVGDEWLCMLTHLTPRQREEP